MYLANIFRAFAKHEIDKRLFLKLGQCIRMLTEEEHMFLKMNVTEGTVSGVGDYVDEFRGQGLMYELDAGFAYSKRVFQLLRYALDYEGNVRLPEKFPERNVMTTMIDDKIDEIWNGTFESDDK